MVREDRLQEKVELVNFFEEQDLPNKLTYDIIKQNDLIAPRFRPYVYGAAPSLAKYISNFGHLVYRGDGKIQPIFRITEDRSIPYIGFLVANELRVTDSYINIDGDSVKFSEDQKIDIDFKPITHYFNQNNTINMRYFLDQIKSGEPMNLINERDIVIIAKTFTGSTDFVHTPAGYMYGVFVLATIVDSVLTHKWLEKVGNKPLLTFGFALLGGFLALFLPTIWFIVGITIGSVLILAFGFASFSYFGFLLPWDMVLLNFVAGSIVVFGDKMRVLETRSKQLRYRLTKFVPDKRLSEMIKNPESLVWDPCGKVVSIMFVDIVNFSSVVEKQSVESVFSDLREVINNIIVSIHEHGGIVQKTLGDGVLAHFGYNYDGEKTRREHTDRTLACAVDIQNKNFQINLNKMAEGKFVYPLRIGIHTSNVFLGNIGDNLLPDITMVGEGVNFAKRMEDTCEPFRIMLSATTLECVNMSLFQRHEFSPRQIHVKHYDKPVSATEVNPLLGFEEQQKQLANHFRSMLGIERNEVRWPLGENINLRLLSPTTSGKVIDFSKSGFLIKLDKYFGKGVKLTINLITDDETLMAELNKNELTQVIVEIRWGAIIKGEYIHGVQISSLTDRQKLNLENILRSRLAGTDYFAETA